MVTSGTNPTRPDALVGRSGLALLAAALLLAVLALLPFKIARRLAMRVNDNAPPARAGPSGRSPDRASPAEFGDDHRKLRSRNLSGLIRKFVVGPGQAARRCSSRRFRSSLRWV